MVYYSEHATLPDPSERVDPGPFVRQYDYDERTIRRSLETYHREDGALKKPYEGRDLLSLVDADQPMSRVTGDVLEALGYPESPKQSV